MSSKQGVTYDWNSKSKKATCTIKYQGHEFVGVAKTHPDDKDMANEYTGNIIAETRATIKLLTFINREQIKPAYDALYHLYNCMTQNKKFNPDSYEASITRRQMHQYENELAKNKEQIAELRQYLIDYIAQKDEFYKSIRTNRKKGQNK